MDCKVPSGISRARTHSSPFKSHEPAGSDKWILDARRKRTTKSIRDQEQLDRAQIRYRGCKLFVTRVIERAVKSAASREYHRKMKE